MLHYDRPKNNIHQLTIINQQFYKIVYISRLVLVKHVFPTFSRNAKISILTRTYTGAFFSPGTTLIPTLFLAQISYSIAIYTDYRKK